MSELKMMVNNLQEQEFFLSHLTKDMRVLEYGSGASTLAIAPLVKEVISIEHNTDWYNDTKSKMPGNVKLFMVPCNKEPDPSYDDGTLDDFKDYVVHPTSFAAEQPFDVIFIDGRARVACAEVCKFLGHRNTLVFIHDFNHPEEKWRRPEYYAVEKYLERMDGVFTMWKFKIKF